MKFRASLVLCCAVALAGCQTQLRLLEADGTLRAEPSNRAGSDYVVHMKNLLGVDYTPDDKANRHRWALEAMKTQCPNGRVVDEAVMEMGKYGIGRAARQYSVYVKCQ